MSARILLVEDDPVSAAFLHSALQALPAEVVLAGSRRQALRAGGHFDACLLDAHLPDGDGAGLLAELRAVTPGLPALAHTAEAGATARTHLLAAGFAGVVAKPIAAARLRAAVRALLAGTAATPAAAAECPRAATPVWDDDDALAALGGNADDLAALRGLFLQELDGQARGVLAALAAGDAAGAHEPLHRLKASTGLVGAARLRAAIDALAATPAEAAARAAFEQAWQASRQPR
ncbi:MAG: response regulator [Pseudoxanthomonas sp.]